MISGKCLAQVHESPEVLPSYQESNTVLVVYYVGSSSCSFSTHADVIEAVRTIPVGFIRAHQQPTKFVFVAMDIDLSEGIKYMREHGTGWDEISIGARYNNESLLRNFNDEVLPATPHVIVYKDLYTIDELNIPHLYKREKLMSTFGADGVIEWIEKGFPLDP